jgi:hypothetical protein
MGANAQIEVPAFTAGQVLTAAEMTQINTGIPVFATTVTRDAAFGGTGEKVLAQGQYAYIEATSALMVYSGSAWIAAGQTPGLTPIVPTSVTVGSGSASTSANGTVTFTGASTVLLNGVFSATHENYLIMIRPSSASASVAISSRLAVGGVPNTTASSYITQNQTAAVSTVYTSKATTTSFDVWNNFGTGNLDDNSVTQTFYGPFLAKNTTGISMLTGQVGTGSEYRLGYYGYWHEVATSYDGYQLILDTGNFGGKISVYGYSI